MDSLLTSGFGKCDVYSPIDISDTHSIGKCIDKCDYSFNYKNSSIPISNKGEYLRIQYDDTSNTETPVSFNSKTYKVSDIRIYSPSLHTYNGVKAQGEIVIIHTPVAGGKQLFVSIPIRLDNISNPGSTVLTSILQNALANIPENGNETKIDNVKNFNLNMIVPKKTYYYYEGVNFLEPPCSISIDVICYLPYSANIGVSNDIILRLQQIITNSNISPKEYSANDTPKLYFNEQGALKLGSGDLNDVVMDCQPFEMSDEPTETVDVVFDTGISTNFNPMDIFKNPWFQIISGSILFFLILCTLNVLFGIIEHKPGATSIGSISSALPFTKNNK